MLPKSNRKLDFVFWYIYSHFVLIDSVQSMIERLLILRSLLTFFFKDLSCFCSFLHAFLIETVHLDSEKFPNFNTFLKLLYVWHFYIHSSNISDILELQRILSRRLLTLNILNISFHFLLTWRVLLEKYDVTLFSFLCVWEVGSLLPHLVLSIWLQCVLMLFGTNLFFLVLMESPVLVYKSLFRTEKMLAIISPISHLSSSFFILLLKFYNP